jgi:LysM repeat protein
MGCDFFMFDRYKIEKGESLETIAKKFNTTSDVLKDINNLYYLDNFREGTDIIVPKNAEKYYDYYLIEKGDSLYKIGQKYNINPELLASLNGLDMKDYIYPNQQILIPKAGYSYYITKEGDTINTVSSMFNITNDRLVNQNQTIYLLGGQILVNKNN